MRDAVPPAAPGLPVVSVIVCTYNRADMLEDALRSVLAQQPSDLSYEVLVVDNNSSDGTRTLVERLMAESARLHYVFQPLQGLSHARNAGIERARGTIITFTDDDVRVSTNWLARILDVFAAHPDADVVGGRVLPDWPATPPGWLTTEHWGPLALVDYGNAPVRVSAEHPICLVGANFSFRREVFDRVGLFSPSLQRVRNGIGSCEDHELLLRLFRTGRGGWYHPDVAIRAAVQRERLDKQYHRRWHAGHGHFHALMRSEHLERSDIGYLLGVPAHLYKQAANDAVGWMRAIVQRRYDEAFGYEVRLRFFGGFFRTRVAEALGSGRMRRLRSLARQVFGRWRRRPTTVVAR